MTVLPLGMEARRQRDRRLVERGRHPRRQAGHAEIVGGRGGAGVLHRDGVNGRGARLDDTILVRQPQREAIRGLVGDGLGQRIEGGAQVDDGRIDLGGRGGAGDGCAPRRQAARERGQEGVIRDLADKCW